VVFSAATIDAALNIWLSYPVYYIEDRRIMHFFADLQKRYTKASIHEKLRVLMANASSMKVRELRRPVEQIFQARNQLVHGSVWFQRVDLIISDSSTLHDRLAMFYENDAFSTDEFARQAIATAEEFLREITVLDAPSSWPDSEDDEPRD
jgi:PhoPQ-activated pathogenicity-related protein